jgi:hypothetical protein
MKITYWASDGSSFLAGRTLNLAFPFGGMSRAPQFQIIPRQRNAFEEMFAWKLYKVEYQNEDEVQVQSQ